MWIKVHAIVHIIEGEKVYANVHGLQHSPLFIHRTRCCCCCGRCCCNLFSLLVYCLCIVIICESTLRHRKFWSVSKLSFSFAHFHLVGVCVCCVVRCVHVSVHRLDLLFCIPFWLWLWFSLRERILWQFEWARRTARHNVTARRLRKVNWKEHRCQRWLAKLSV